MHLLLTAALAAAVLAVVGTPTLGAVLDAAAPAQIHGLERSKAAECREVGGSCRMPSASGVAARAGGRRVVKTDLRLLQHKTALGLASGGLDTSVEMGRADSRTGDAFTFVDRGIDRACRGATNTDASGCHYTLVGLAKATSLEVCKALCIAKAGCRGVDYSKRGCQLWTRPGGIGTSAESKGHVCLRYEPFVPVDGGSDRACRGARSADNSLSHYTAVDAERARSLEACQALCAAKPGCKGVEYSAQRCKLWTRPEGIGTTVPAEGFSCFRYEPFVLVDGWDRSCSRGSTDDVSADHYRFHSLAKARSLEACKALCTGTPSCQGVEFSRTGCKVWTRPGSISSTVKAAGSVCLRYGLAAAGIEETWPRVGQIRLAVQPDKCLDAFGGGTYNGVNLQIADCADGIPGQRFHLAGDGTGHLRWNAKCVDVSAGRNVIGNNVQLWDCEEPPHRNMQFLLPGSGVGRIRWVTNPDKCLDVSGGNVRIWSCDAVAWPTQEFILPPGSGFQVRTTKYVMHYLPWFLGYNTDAYCARNAATCSYANDHWCSAYGNSFYTSNKGAYDITNQAVIDLQLDEMKDAGLDGIWINYQTTNWDEAIERFIRGTMARGMGFAIMIDDAIHPGIMEMCRDQIKRWTREPHYFRYQGFPLIPIFNSPRIHFSSSISAVYLSRAELATPRWATDTYPWIHPDEDFLKDFYRQQHPSLVAGTGYRGFHDCYLHDTLGPSYVGMLGPSLKLATEYKPDFLQLNTWNDYTEGTMLEPSWLREEKTCVDVCVPLYHGKGGCPMTHHCGSNHSFIDCTKPVGRFAGPGHPKCGITGDLSARTDLDQIKGHILAERAAEASLLTQ